MKHVHVLPTDKPSTLFKDDFGNLIYSINMDQEQNHFEPQHLFITSDEEIKAGDWYYLPRTNLVYECTEDPTELNLERSLGVRKIILTTDPDLIKDGVQAIDDEFLEWFVKNPSCEEVEVGYGWIRLTETDNEGYWVSIPDKQFEMQQERMYSKEDLKEVYFSAIKSTGEGRNGEYASGNSPVDIKKEFNEEFEKWFEQFKKK